MAYSAETYMAKINPIDPDPLSMALAAQVILEGGLVAFPTETVYGLGANALNADAVERIFKAKDSQQEMLVVHIEDTEQLELVATNIPYRAHEIAKIFWPGALTLLLKRSHLIPDIVTSGKNAVAVRLPAHPVAQSLVRKAGVPIAAPSANRHGRPSPTSAVHVMHDLSGRVDVVLDAGKSHIGVESSIVDFTLPMPTLVRPGGVTLEELRIHLPSLAFRAQHPRDDNLQSVTYSIMTYYRPNAELLVFEGNQPTVWKLMRKRARALLDDNKRVGIMVLDDDVFQFEGVVAQYVLLGQDVEAMAANLFSGMREMDAAEMDVIMVRAPQKNGLGLPIYDRLLGATDGRIIQASDA